MIVECLRCGLKNRIPDPPRKNGLYRCGSPGCQVVLNIPHASGSSEFQKPAKLPLLSKTPFVSTRPLFMLGWLMMGVIAGVSIFYAVKFSGPLEQPSPHAEQDPPVAMPSTRPSIETLDTISPFESERRVPSATIPSRTVQPR